jgi:hypothetical protein
VVAVLAGVEHGQLIAVRNQEPPALRQRQVQPLAGSHMPAGRVEERLAGSAIVSAPSVIIKELRAPDGAAVAPAVRAERDFGGVGRLRVLRTDRAIGLRQGNLPRGGMRNQRHHGVVVLERRQFQRLEDGPRP